MVGWGIKNKKLRARVEAIDMESCARCSGRWQKYLCVPEDTFARLLGGVFLSAHEYKEIKKKTSRVHHSLAASLIPLTRLLFTFRIYIKKCFLRRRKLRDFA